MAKTAICTNSLGFNFEDSTTTEKLDQVVTVTYDGRLGTDEVGSSFIDEGLSLFGPPPFLKVKITAGLEKLKGFTASVASTTSGGAQPTGDLVPAITPAPTLGTSLVVQTGAPASSTKTGGSAQLARAGFCTIIAFVVGVACIVL